MPLPVKGDDTSPNMESHPGLQQTEPGFLSSSGGPGGTPPTQGCGGLKDKGQQPVSKVMRPSDPKKTKRIGRHP